MSAVPRFVAVGVQPRADCVSRGRSASFGLDDPASSAGQRHTRVFGGRACDVDGDIRRQRDMGSRSARPCDVAALAGRQDGVVARAQLLAGGHTAAAIDHHVRTGRLLALHRGVYAVGHAAVGERGRMRAALLAAGPGAVLSHRTAAHLWRLTASMPPFVEVTVTHGRRRSRQGLVVHTTTDSPGNPYEGRPSPHRSVAHAGRPATLVARRQSTACAARRSSFASSPTANSTRAGLLPPDVAPARSELERRFRSRSCAAPVSRSRGSSTRSAATRSTSPGRPSGSSWRPTAGPPTGTARFERDRARDAYLMARG